MSESNGKFKYLVADTTAFINTVPLNNYAENILTVPDVVNEVKNKRQIRRLVVLPFDLQVREPKEECLAYVTQFSKKTGDFLNLSVIDLKVIALTYELEKEHVGIEHLRSEPVVSKVIASKNKPEVFEDKLNLAGFYIPKKGAKLKDKELQKNIDYNSHEDLISETLTIENLEIGENQNAKEDKEEDEIDCSDEDDEEFISDLAKCFQEVNISSQIEEDDILVLKRDINISEHESSCEDDDAWITPSNVKKLKNKFFSEEANCSTVACMSTDFAIQNVLKQMNLNISALNGRVIKNLKTYILRCYACFKTTTIMTKIFCPTCGNKTLKRVAVSLDENGEKVIHINTKRPLTAKYKNQSLPRFTGGKHSSNPILFEDQPIPKQMPSRVAKTKTDALDDNYIAGISPFVLRDVDSKSALLRKKGNIKQWAQNNAYEEQRRHKKFNRLVK